MSPSREKLDAWHAELNRQHAERMDARERERRQRLAKPATPAEPAPSTFDADHVTSRGIRSVWD